MKKYQLKLVYLKSIHVVNNNKISHEVLRICYVIKDLSWFYLCRMSNSAQIKKSNNFVIIKHVNKFVDYVNLNKILNQKDSFNTFPIVSKYFAIPSVSYKYERTIRSKVLNYQQVYSEALDPINMTCRCSQNNFVDKHHKHVVTGDLLLIDNLKLRNLLSKGLNYRDQASPSKSKAIDSIKTGLDNYIKKISDVLNFI